MAEIWFDPTHGTLISNDETTTPEIPENALLLKSLLLADNFEIPEGTFEPMSARNIDKEYGFMIGEIMVEAITAENEREPLTDEHLRRMHVLGLLPDRNYIQRRFGSLLNFQSQIGAERLRTSSMYDLLPRQEIFEQLFAAHEIHGNGGPLTLDAINLYHRFDLIPSYGYLYKRFGGVKKLNEYLDYPDVASWDMSDYISYGATVLQENGPDSLTVKNIETLGKQKFGPYPQAIKKRFGSWTVFKQLSEEESRHRQTLLEAKEKSIHSHFQQIGYGDLEPRTHDERIASWAKYHVASDCLPRTSATTLITLATTPTINFVASLQQCNKNLTTAQIEIVAISLQVFDDIWPPLHRRIPKIRK